MAATLSMTLALSACASTAPTGTVQTAAAAPLVVTNNGQPFAFHDGAAAKRVAMDSCAAQGGVLQTSIYDRFDNGAWVYPEGCA
jgi:hypothetical protein